MEMYVISKEKDGAELRREKRKNPYHTVCKEDNSSLEINEAMDRCAGGYKWAFSEKAKMAWDRIFRGK
jgi:hypothetical protein